MIQVDELEKRFGDLVAVDRISLQVKAGEILALLGPNGAGKTTTVRILAAILKPTSGRATVAGYDTVREAEEVRHRVGLLTEVPGLYRRMNSLDYLDFFGKLQRMSEAQRKERIPLLLNKFGLWEARRMPLGNYSKGMSHKLALIRALLHDPPVLLLDEPTSALDPSSSRVVRDHILELGKDRHRAIVVCTHNLAEAEELADRVAIISQGRIIAVGSVEDLRRRFLGPPTYALRLRDSVDCRELLSDLVESVAQEGKEILFRVQDAERVNPLVIQRLVERGVEMISLSEVERNLETVYLRIVENCPARPEKDRQ